MKKFFVMFVLFALPILAYLFFASGIPNFDRLPVLTQEVQELDHFSTAQGEDVSLQGNITILGFYGEQPSGYTGNAYVLAEKIYDNYFKFKDFQLLIAVPEGTEEQTEQITTELEKIVDPQKWKFVFAAPEDIKNLFGSLNTNLELQSDLSSPYVFIIDKDGMLRGRSDDEDEHSGMLYGYDTRSVALLDDKMDDDVKVLLAEYRLALKRNNPEKKD